MTANQTGKYQELSDFSDFRIGNCRVLPSRGEIEIRGERTSIEPRILQVLLLLADRRGNTVSRRQMIEEVWEGMAVTDDAINRCISSLRRIFNSEPEIRILTVPKIGYRFEVSATAEESSEPSLSTLTRGLSWRRGTAAVLACLGIILVIGGLFSTKPESDSHPATVRLVPLTTEPGFEVQPSFSPDGSHVAYAGAGSGTDRWDIYVRSTAMASPRRLTQGPGRDGSPVWSPLGDLIAFTRRTGDEPCRILAVPPLGGPEREIATCHSARSPWLAWHPKGDRLAFNDRLDPSQPMAIFEVSLPGGKVTRLTDPPPGTYGDEQMVYSPDGNRLAFVRSQAIGVMDLYLLDMAASRPRRLTSDHLKVHGLAWKGGRPQLVFASNRGGSFRLWELNLPTLEIRALQPGGRNVDSVAVSSDGRRIAYQEWVASTAIRKVNAAGEQQEVFNSTQFDWDVTPSPDGRSLAFISDRSGSAELWISNRDGSSLRRLTSLEGPYAQRPAWSPDGKEILLAIPIEGNFDIYRVRVESHALDRLTEHPTADFAPVWSPDGKQIFFSSRRSGQWEIWRKALGGSEEPRRITATGGRTALPSSDGRVLFFSKPSEPGLWKLDLDDGGVEEQLISDLQPLDWNNWDLGAGSLFYVSREAGETPELRRFDLSTGESTRVALLPGLFDRSGIRFSPAEQCIYYTVVDLSESDLYLIDYRRG